MKKVGESVQEAIDYMNGGLAQYALVPTVAALAKTAEKNGIDFSEFIKANWDLIAFTGLPRALPLPLAIPFGLKKIVPQFNVHHGAPEIVLFLVRETLGNGKIPNNFIFHSSGEFEIENGVLYLPDSLIFGLLGGVIFDSANKNESIGDKYWMHISDFKMFISELWGRRDLAERIMKFYRE